MSSFEYVFPSIRGHQGGREYFISMCPLRLIPKIFLFDEDELRPEVRAQRILNRSRVPEIASYILANREDYVFSALTASIDGEAVFKSGGGAAGDLGTLHVPMDSRFLINDGQHRRAAIEEAMRVDPSLSDETIAIVFFLDQGLERSQQMFADLNRHAVKPSRSLGLLYDHRSEMASIARHLCTGVDCFKGLVETEKTTLTPRSKKLFTLSALYSATEDFLVNSQNLSPEDQISLATRFWGAVASAIPEWELVAKSRLTSGDVRAEFLHSHAIGLQAIARAGADLLVLFPGDWEQKIKKVGEIDWRRSNVDMWEGRALLGGRVSKARQNMLLTTMLVKEQLGLPTDAEQSSLRVDLK